MMQLVDKEIESDSSKHNNRRTMHDEYAGVDQHVAYVKRVPANAEHAAGHQISRINLFLHSPALDVGIADDHRPNGDAGKHRQYGEAILDYFQASFAGNFMGRNRTEKQQQNNDGEKFIASLEEKISDTDHY
jgi:hypothetical protein